MTDSDYQDEDKKGKNTNQDCHGDGDEQVNDGTATHPDLSMTYELVDDNSMSSLCD